MELGERIKAKRKQARLSAEDLALSLGLKKENIYKWERGSTPSNPEEYSKIMGWLNSNLENGTNKAESITPKTEDNYSRLVRTMENLSEDKIRSTAIIEKLVDLMREHFNSGTIPSQGQQPPPVYGPQFEPVQPGKGKGKETGNLSKKDS